MTTPLPKTYWYYPWQPGAVPILYRCTLGERGAIWMMADDSWASNGKPFVLEPEALADRLGVDEDLSPHMPMIRKVWPRIEEYLDEKRTEKKIKSNINRDNVVMGRYGGAAESAEDSFHPADHESSPLWPTWIEVLKSYSGDRIKAEDFLIFEAEVEAGADPAHILAQAKAYTNNKAEGVGGYSFANFLQKGLYKNTFKPKGKLGKANDAGRDRLEDQFYGAKP